MLIFGLMVKNQNSLNRIIELNVQRACCEKTRLPPPHDRQDPTRVSIHLRSRLCGWAKMVGHNLDFILPQRCGAQWQAAYAAHVSLQIRRFQQAALLPKGYLNAVVGDDMYCIDGVKRDTSKLLRSLARNERTTPRVSILPRCVCCANGRTRRTSGRCSLRMYSKRHLMCSLHCSRSAGFFHLAIRSWVGASTAK